jgi:hypothetical protein
MLGAKEEERLFCIHLINITYRTGNGFEEILKKTKKVENSE